MKKWKNAIIVSLLIGSVGFGFAGCGSNTMSTEDKQIVTFANTTDISTMDPRNANSTAMATILFHVYNGLLKTDADGNVVPDLAESYKQISDTEWEFTLKDGVKFQDGSPLTAEDVKYTLDTIADPSKQFRLKSDFSFMKARVIDDKHVVISTGKPYAAFPLRLTYIKIIPKEYVEKVGDTEFAKKPIGTGPYRFVSWKKGDRVELEANENYFGGIPEVKRIVARVIPEASNRILALESGEVDIAATIPTSEVNRIQEKDGLKVVGNPTTRVVFIGLNSKDCEPLKDVRVRQALNYAIDRDAIIQGVLDGYGNKIATIATPQFEGFDKNIPVYEYNPEKAKQLLSEAGYPDGFSVDFSTTDATMNGIDVAQAVSAQLSDIGIKCNVIQQEPNQQREKIASGQVAPLYINGIGGPYANLDLIAKLGFGTGERYSTFSDSQFDSLRKEAILTVDLDRRLDLDSQIQQMARDKAMGIFLWQQQMLYAYNANRIKGWNPRVDEMIDVNGVSL